MEWLTEIWGFLVQAFDVLLHLEEHIAAWVAYLGPFVYVALFLVIFAETGLVITPFLPGDSLLFALGALTAGGDAAPLSFSTLWVSLTIAGILGDSCNYSLGQYFGPKVFYSPTSWLLNRDHLLRAKEFYERHGGKTIVYARFLPIIRTFAPFVAGIGGMKYLRFMLYNVFGGIAWVTLFLAAGHFFGNLPSVKKNFTLVIMAIIVISALPAALEFMRGWRGRKT